jgi:hypothetical protein
MVLQHLYDVDGAKGVHLIEEVLCEAGGWAVVKSSSLFIVA